MALDELYQRQIDLLREAVRAHKIALKDVSKATGVHVSQVSRILAGQAKRGSHNVVKICKYANLMAPPVASINQTPDANQLLQAINSIWDGTPDHALALEKLLSAIGEYQATFKTSSKINT